MGITSVYVTHDQAEAMVISDRIAVMQSGDIMQIGTPAEIYEKPANTFVADFIGTTNFIDGEVVEVDADTSEVVIRTGFGETMRCRTADVSETTPNRKVKASIRPEDVTVFAAPPEQKENLFKGAIVHRAYLGNFLYFFVSVEDVMIRVQVAYNLPHEEGEDIYLFLDPEKTRILF
jgi:iron(III) transport system ATP-binding protein